jgi:HEAT repeat protein
MCGHSILETARDALFLRSLPVSQLPWVYLIIAALTFGVAAIELRLAARIRRRDTLALFLVFASFVTGCLWLAADFVSLSSIWMLYVWTGLFGTLATIHFWLSVSATFTVTEAKRLFGSVGAGALVGAIAGSALARLLVSWAETRNLVLLASLSMLLGAAVAHFALRRALRNVAGTKQEGIVALSEPVPVGAAVRSLRNDPYARLVVSFVFLSTIALTLADYLFKRRVAESIAPADLASFFATFYIALNAIALVVQVMLVGWLLDRFGVSRALIILPTLLVAGGVWAAVGTGLSTVVLLKGADGSLRHSLHRTATEVLFVPLSRAERDRAKTVSDVVGQRGGQAIASVLILIGAWAIGGGSWIAWTIAASALAAGAIAFFVRGPYLDVFRRNLGADRGRTIRSWSPLDRSALEAAVAALDGARERDVLGALEVLREQHRVDLVPALVLRHRSARVVGYALECFVEAGRRDFVTTALSLLDTDDSDLHAALLRAIAAVSPDEGILRDALNEPSRRVRATAIVELCALGQMDTDEARRRLHESMDQAAVRRAICAVLAVRPHPPLADLLAELADDNDPSVRAEAISAIAASGDAHLWPVLLAALRERALRALARQGFLDAGEVGLAFLIDALEAENLPHAIRLHVPRSISVFDSERATPALFARLGRESDAAVRHEILRALGSLARTRTTFEIDREEVTRLLATALERCQQLAAWLHAIAGAIAERPECHTATSNVPRDLLSDELAFVLEQVFHLLAFLHRGEDFRSIRRGLASYDPVKRASSHELLREVLRYDDAHTLLHLVRVCARSRIRAGPQRRGRQRSPT